MLAAIVCRLKKVEVVAWPNDRPKLCISVEHMCKLSHEVGYEPRMGCSGRRAQVLGNQLVCRRGAQHVPPRPELHGMQAQPVARMRRRKSPLPWQLRSLELHDDQL